MRIDRKLVLPILLLVFTAGLIAGCGTIKVDSPHLNIHKDGYAANDKGYAIQIPAVKERGKTAEEREVDKLIEQISAQVTKDCRRSNNKRTHLMLFVHGGMKSTRAAMVSSRKLDDSRVFSSRDIRPIYVNWNSSLNSAVADDLFWVRGGQRTVEGVIVFPIIVAWRASIGIFNAIPSWYYQVVDETRFFQKWPAELDPTIAEMAGDGVVGLVHAPFSIVSTPLLTGFGRGAWEMMKRRVGMMFAVQKGPKRFGFRKDDPYPGVMRTFLDQLIKKRGDWENQCEAFELDFVGHSMGTLVGTRILREYPSLKFDRVIFLAAASTVEEYVTAVPPYLERQKQSAFYNISLSVIDEGNELTLKSYVLPRGSLLVWIDNFLDPILSPEDFRTGDSFNESIFGFPLNQNDSRCDRMSMLKIVAPRNKRSTWPRKHGDFNDSDYVGRLLDLTLISNVPTRHQALVEECGEDCAVYAPCKSCYLKSPEECP